jgi:hypothetical protein
VKFFQEQEGIFSTDEIISVCFKIIPDQNPISPYIAFPGEITFLRSFLFALTSQTNSFDISNKNFLKAVSRFGIDSPFPSIAKKLYLYGNEINVAEVIKEKVNSFEDAQKVVLGHQMNVVGSNVIIRQPQGKNVAVGLQNLKMLEAKKKTTKVLEKVPPKNKQSSINFGYTIHDPNKKESSSSLLGNQKVL